jgi:hypothetical protein
MKVLINSQLALGFTRLFIEYHVYCRFQVRCMVDHVDLQLGDLQMFLIEVVFVEDFLPRGRHVSCSNDHTFRVLPHPEEVDFIDYE